MKVLEKELLLNYILEKKYLDKKIIKAENMNHFINI